MTLSRSHPPVGHAVPGAPLPWLLILVLTVSGCVSKSKAKLEAQRAFLAGQQEAMMRLQQSRDPNIRVVGQVRNESIPWTQDLTLARAVIAADYFGPADPRLIVIVRQGQPIQVDPKRLLNGEDIPLQQGDLLQIIP